MTEPTQSLTEFLAEFKNNEYLSDPEAQHLAVLLENFITVLHQFLNAGINSKRLSLLTGRCLLIADEAHKKSSVSEEHMTLLHNQFHRTFDIRGQQLSQFSVQPPRQTIAHPLYVGDDEE